MSAVGLGCWAIGGAITFQGNANQPLGWGETDDAESIRAITCALDLGINFFDTADSYGAGRSERVLGQALKGHREQVVIATKFGNGYDEEQRVLTNGIGADEFTLDRIRSACEASLRRLGTDYIDLYQLHVNLSLSLVDSVLDSLETLVSAGLIRAYAWSTDDPARAAAFARGKHCAAVQCELNAFKDNSAMLDVCVTADLAAVCRTVLAMGLLSGKYGPESTFPVDDIRHHTPSWLAYYKEGRPNAAFLAKLNAIREVLTSDGRTMTQGALAWVLARSARTIPIPGFKTVEQVKEHARAMELGPLRQEQLAEVAALLRQAEQ